MKKKDKIEKIWNKSTQKTMAVMLALVMGIMRSGCSMAPEQVTEEVEITTDDTTTDDTTTEEPVVEPTVYEKIDLVNLTREEAKQIIDMCGIEGITIYGHKRMTKSMWLFGTQSAIDEAKEKIADFDSTVASASSTVHTYTATNCSVETLMSRLSDVNIEGVTFQTYDYSNLTNSIIVYCDASTWNNQVYDLLAAFDTVSTIGHPNFFESNSVSISVSFFSFMSLLFNATTTGIPNSSS